MIQRSTALAISAVFALSLCACAGGEVQVTPDNQSASTNSSATVQNGVEGQDQSASANDADASQTPEYDPMVDSIDLTTDAGNVRFVRIEKANADLTKEENALVCVLDFTNAKNEPAEPSEFKYQFFQNGAELEVLGVTFADKGGQYKLNQSYNDTALKGGTVTFGRIIVPVDNSPVTIMVTGAGENNYQTMEVTIDNL